MRLCGFGVSRSGANTTARTPCAVMRCASAYAHQNNSLSHKSVCVSRCLLACRATARSTAPAAAQQPRDYAFAKLSAMHTGRDQPMLAASACCSDGAANVLRVKGQCTPMGIALAACPRLAGKLAATKRATTKYKHGKRG